MAFTIFRYFSLQMVFWQHLFRCFQANLKSFQWIIFFSQGSRKSRFTRNHQYLIIEIPGTFSRKREEENADLKKHSISFFPRNDDNPSRNSIYRIHCGKMFLSHQNAILTFSQACLFLSFVVWDAKKYTLWICACYLYFLIVGFEKA